MIVVSAISVLTKQMYAFVKYNNTLAYSSKNAEYYDYRISDQLIDQKDFGFY